jgi:hypothetical protein
MIRVDPSVRPPALRRARWAIPAAILGGLSLLACPLDARADWKPRSITGAATTEAQLAEAKAIYARGLVLYKQEGDVTAALAQMERAYDLAPSAIVLFNIGQVARTGKDYVAALRAFELYLAQGGAEVTDENRREVQSQLSEIRGFIGTVDLRVKPDGATILVDDVEVGRAPLAEPVLLKVGAHKIVAQLSGQLSSRTVTIVGGDRQPIDLIVEVKPAQPAPAPVAPPAGPPKPVGEAPPGRPLWIGWVTAGALGAAGAVTGALALTKSGQLGDQHYVGPTPSDAASSASSGVKALAITTDVLIGSALVAGGVTLAFTLMGPSKPAAGQASVKLRGGPGYLGLSGQF